MTKGRKRFIYYLPQTSALIYTWTLSLNSSCACASEVPTALSPPPLTITTATLTLSLSLLTFACCIIICVISLHSFTFGLSAEILRVPVKYLLLFHHHHSLPAEWESEYTEPNTQRLFRERGMCFSWDLTPQQICLHQRWANLRVSLAHQLLLRFSTKMLFLARSLTRSLTFFNALTRSLTKFFVPFYLILTRIFWWDKKRVWSRFMTFNRSKIGY